MNPIPKFFKDGYGSFSATRLVFVLWALGVLSAWLYTAFKSPELASKVLDPSVVTILGILMTGKTVQSFSSNDGPNGVTSPPKPIDASPAQAGAGPTQALPAGG
ncbi:hypothetical protein [Cupriavidus sp. UME77]|uniref:hypothetical protein n=1 Tax=Cupriavidus sp. UME77 TaxID=1862321 RepID=UPI001600E9A4|nr:hypothetical protein [Cupriavidus sp. UME77]